jgi:plastocyanin
MRQARLDSAKRQERVLRKGAFPGRRGGPGGRPRAGTRLSAISYQLSAMEDSPTSPTSDFSRSSLRPINHPITRSQITRWKQVAKMAPLGVAGLLAAALLSANQTVTVGPGMTFTPANVTVVPGETVTWTWAGAPHSSTSNATSGPEFWDSGVLSTGTFSHLFSTPGTYPYYCIIHSSPAGTAMNGIVQVVLPPTATPTPSPSAPTFTPTPTPAASASPAAAIPMLDGGARLLFAFGLLAAALAVFSRSRR